MLEIGNFVFRRNCYFILVQLRAKKTERDGWRGKEQDAAVTRWTTAWGPDLHHWGPASNCLVQATETADWEPLYRWCALRGPQRQRTENPFIGGVPCAGRRQRTENPFIGGVPCAGHRDSRLSADWEPLYWWCALYRLQCVQLCKAANLFLFSNILIPYLFFLTDL